MAKSVKQVENEALTDAKQLVSDIEAIVVPSAHRYAGMVQTKLNEAKTWASKMVEELAGEAQQDVANVAQKAESAADESEKTE